MLRKVIESISSDFDVVLIDCEAGLEQINRMVIKSVDIILIISDISLRSIDTAKSIRKSANKFTSYRKIGVIINRVKGDVSNILDKLRGFDLPLITLIPEDDIITKYDLEGKAIIEIPEESKCFQEIKKSLIEILEI